ncbi:beta-N-acetylhexosaminidase [Sphingomonas sp.]|uniref:beta-N-acetylhexosaminidase n=1 Tax=Sphingomonas sp. TaxID=28214 RepID=UPI0038A68FCC
MQAAIYGFEGPVLTDEERRFFGDADPAGFILFRRNCENQAQLLRLTDSLRELTGRDDVPVLIDQEGGRVARMRPPEWPAFPAAERFADLYRAAPSSAIEAARSNARGLGLMLRAAGVNVNAAPLLDVRQEGASDIIGDRALGSEPMQVAALGRAVLDGLASVGVVGIIKHMPGHGRALVDSHHELPVVTASAEELDVDLEPFERLASAPMGMVAHVVYIAWDAGRPASQSPVVIADVIRERIGFDGFLMSDDSDMNALTGTLAERAAKCVAAGCDVALPCNGVLSDNIAIAHNLGDISLEGAERLARAMAGTRIELEGIDFAEEIAKRDQLLALA